MAKSLLEYAYEFVSKKSGPVSFEEIWAYVTKEAGLSEDEAKAKVARFYTNLMLDGRFVNVGNNSWDLRTRQKFDKVHIDMRDVYNDVDSSDDEDDEDEEEKEYNRMLEDNSAEPEESSSDDEENKEENENLY